MKAIGKYSYNIIFWISRIFTISVFGICLSVILHAKYVLPEKSLSLFSCFVGVLWNGIDFIKNFLFSINVDIDIVPKVMFCIFSTFCKNSQNIDLLFILLFLILIISFIIIKIIDKKNKYYLLLLVAVIFIVYIAMYTIFRLPIILALSIITPVIYIIILVLNKKCPIQKIIMLMPIIGEIMYTKNIVNYIFKSCTETIRSISLLIVALIVSNVICFLIPYKTDKDFENLLIDEYYTYSIKPYKDKLIISGNKKFIIIDDKGDNLHINNSKFGFFEDFIINEDKKEIYVYDRDKNILFILDSETLNIKKENPIDTTDFDKYTADPARICCNKKSLQLLIVFEHYNFSHLYDLITGKIIQKYNVLLTNECIIYNDYRNCFLASFYERTNFLQEIDVDNKKIRKIKADEYQGYITISERNKEIYIAFYQQGKIYVYDIETMKLKRKIKSSYMIKDITYDEELNILIAPSYFTGYVDIFLMDGRDKLLTREFVGYELREGCFDSQKENLYVCSPTGLYKKKIDIKKLIKENSKR